MQQLMSLMRRILKHRDVWSLDESRHLPISSHNNPPLPMYGRSIFTEYPPNWKVHNIPRKPRLSLIVTKGLFARTPAGEGSKLFYRKEQIVFGRF